jgi:hypothetical protein
MKVRASSCTDSYFCVVCGGSVEHACTFVGEFNQHDVSHNIAEKSLKARTSNRISSVCMVYLLEVSRFLGAAYACSVSK